MNEPGQRYRTILNLPERVEVIKEYELFYPKPKIMALATKFNVGCSQIRNILFNQEATLKAYEKYVKSKQNSPGKSKNLKVQQTLEDTNVLSVNARLKVIHEYTYKNPKPTISSLASKYNVSSQVISNALRSRESFHFAEDDYMERHKQREDQIKFLGMVMYEYLQRALYHNVPLDDLLFQKKAAEVKECIAITKFRPSYLWLSGFKKLYAINDLSLESLRTQIVFTTEKESSLDAVDMVRYVRMHKSSLFEKELEQNTPQTSQPKTWIFSADERNSRPKLQLKQNKPTIVYVRDEMRNSSGAAKGQTSLSDIAKTNEDTGSLPVKQKQLKIVKTPKTPQAQSLLKNLEQHFKKSDLNRIIVKGRRSKVNTAISEKDLSQNKNKEMQFSNVGNNAEMLKFFQIFDETSTSSAADTQQSHTNITPPLSCIDTNSDEVDLSGIIGEGIMTATDHPSVEHGDDEQNVTHHNQYTSSLQQCSSSVPSVTDNNSQKNNLNGNTYDGITIKTEPQSIEDNDAIQMETNHNQNSPYDLYANSQPVDNYKDMVIKIESSTLPLDEDDIKPTHFFEASEEFIMDKSQNYLSSLSKRPRSNSPSSDVLDEDIKPTLITDEFLTENSNIVNDKQPLSRLATHHQPHTDLTSPHVVDEDIKPKLISEEFLMETNCQQPSSSFAAANQFYSAAHLPDISTPVEAMKLLEVLENYAVLKSNCRAICLLTSLEEAFKEPPQ